MYNLMALRINLINILKCNSLVSPSDLHINFIILIFNFYLLPTIYFIFQRATLIESLSQVQASQDEVSQLTTISAIQTLGLRKLTEFNIETTNSKKQEDSEINETKKYSSIAGMF